MEGGVLNRIDKRIVRKENLTQSNNASWAGEKACKKAGLQKSNFVDPLHIFLAPISGFSH